MNTPPTRASIRSTYPRTCALYGKVLQRLRVEAISQPFASRIRMMARLDRCDEVENSVAIEVADGDSGRREAQQPVRAPHAHLGEVPVLFVMACAGETVETEALLGHCRAQLSASKVPHAVHLIKEIPRTGSGKIIRCRLKELLSA